MRFLLIAACAVLFINVAALANPEPPRGFQRITEMYQEQRAALVIGNARYVNAPLANPVNDAEAIAKSLRSVGFDVDLLIDAGRDEMATSIQRLGSKLSGEGGVALVYFAGHGMQVDGENYLIPVGSKLDRAPGKKFSPIEIRLNTVTIAQILKEMDASDNRVNILVLDACRNNPYARQTRAASVGLAEIKSQDTPRGTLIAFATAPGDVASDGAGNNSVYTTHLLANMTRPGLTLEKLFKEVRKGVMVDTGNDQTPWENTSMTGDFYFIPPTSTDTLNGESTVEDMELAFWHQTKAVDEIAMYQMYLRMYPNGKFAPLAGVMIEKLSVVEATPSVMPAPEAPKESVPVASTGPAALSSPNASASGEAYANVLRARAALKRGALTMPADDNAALWSEQVLAVDPNNQDAKTILVDIVEKYLIDVLDKLASGKPELASQSLGIVRTLQHHASSDQIDTVNRLAMVVRTKLAESMTQGSAIASRSQASTTPAPARVPTSHPRKSNTDGNKNFLEQTTSLIKESAGFLDSLSRYRRSK